MRSAEFVFCCSPPLPFSFSLSHRCLFNLPRSRLFTGPSARRCSRRARREHLASGDADESHTHGSHTQQFAVHRSRIQGVPGTSRPLCWYYPGTVSGYFTCTVIIKITSSSLPTLACRITTHTHARWTGRLSLSEKSTQQPKLLITQPKLSFAFCSISRC